MCTWVGRGREREGGERIPSRFHTISAEPDVGLDMGLKLTNHEIMTWAKIKSWVFNRLNYPGASLRVVFCKGFCAYSLTHDPANTTRVGRLFRDYSSVFVSKNFMSSMCFFTWEDLQPFLHARCFPDRANPLCLGETDFTENPSENRTRT